jgi:tetratricopeptide (TPR) repeat protein
MEAPTLEDQPSESPTICSHCGEMEREEGFALPLCAQCRDALSRYPFPAWIRISCAIVLGVSIFAGIRSINSFRAGIAFERGQRAEQHGQFAVAANYYEQVVERFPDSTLALARLAITRFHAGQVGEALGILNRLRGRETSPKLAAELDQVIRAIQNTRPPNRSR